MEKLVFFKLKLLPVQLARVRKNLNAIYGMSVTYFLFEVVVFICGLRHLPPHLARLDIHDKHLIFQLPFWFLNLGLLALRGRL